MGYGLVFGGLFFIVTATPAKALTINKIIEPNLDIIKKIELPTATPVPPTNTPVPAGVRIPIKLIDLNRVTVTPVPTKVKGKAAINFKNVDNITQKMVEKLEYRFTYLELMKEKLQLRIETLATTRNMTEAKLKLEKYDTSKYENDLRVLNERILQLKKVGRPMDVMPQLRVDVKKVLTDLQELHDYQIEVLDLIVKAPKLK